jgi:hypothetical protein
MDKNPNRTMKGRNKFNANQAININNPYVKRPNKMNPMMNFETNMNNPFLQNQEFIPTQPYPVPVMYQAQIPMPMPQSKEQNIKNAFKMYQGMQGMSKKSFHQNNPSEYMMNFGEKEMSLEDNAFYGNKKFNNKNRSKVRMIKKRKNVNNKSNKELSNMNIYNNNNMVEAGQNINNRAISTDHNINNEENFPETKFNDDMNYNNYYQKGGKKKATTVEYNNRNKNKKGYNKNKKKNNEYSNLADNPYASDFSDIDQKSNNIKPYYNKSNDASDIEEDSHLANNNDNKYSHEDGSNEDDKNSQDIIIVEDSKDNTTPKEVLDIKNFGKLIEKSDSMQNGTKNNKKK